MKSHCFNKDAFRWIDESFGLNKEKKKSRKRNEIFLQTKRWRDVSTLRPNCDVTKSFAVSHGLATPSRCTVKFCEHKLRPSKSTNLTSATLQLTDCTRRLLLIKLFHIFLQCFLPPCSPVSCCLNLFSFFLLTFFFEIFFEIFLFFMPAFSSRITVFEGRGGEPGCRSWRVSGTLGGQRRLRQPGRLASP